MADEGDRVTERPRVRVKAPSRMYAAFLPDDAVPGDVIIGNRNAYGRVAEYISPRNPLSRALYLEY